MDKPLPYLDRILNQKSIPGNAPPTDVDVEVACMALAGSKIAEIKTRHNMTPDQVQSSIKRVRDAIRAGQSPEKVQDRFPEIIASLVALSDERDSLPPTFRAPEQMVKESIYGMLHKAGIDDVPPDVLARIELIGRRKYTRPVASKPQTISKFLQEVRVATLEVVAPLTGQLLAIKLIQGSHLEQGIEVSGLTPNKKGPLIAQQFNFGEEKGRQLRAGLNYEKLLNQTKKALPPAKEKSQVIEAEVSPGYDSTP